MSDMPESARSAIKHLVADYGIVGVIGVVLEVVDGIARDMEREGTSGVVRAYRWRDLSGRINHALFKFDDREDRP